MRSQTRHAKGLFASASGSIFSPMDIFKASERLMGLDDAEWAHHAAPWSVYTRFTILPLIVCATWMREPLGWWIILPIMAVVVWIWANPRVFLEIAEVMLFLANKGVDVFRLDAVAFMWKRMGTRCQSEPEVHMILQALRAVCRIVCPAVIHLEEAIVSPSEMLPYLGRGVHDGKEGNLAYHNSLMVQFWSALA